MNTRSHRIAATLVPQGAGLRLEHIDRIDRTIDVTLTSITPSARCPHCGQPSWRIRGRYQRTLADLPWSGLTVRLSLTVRKFACDLPTCRQRIFTERLPTVTVPYARRTNRLTDILRAIAFTSGGEAGHRLLDRLHMPASASTLLRVIGRTPMPDPGTPRVLSIDDWARRRGQTYGTILVDLERRRPIDLLPDRTAAAISTWLADHPGVEIISRDRGGVYAEGAASGASTAVQVADRWHLLHNLADALERAFVPHRTRLLATARAGSGGESPEEAVSPEAISIPAPRRKADQALSAERRAARLERFLRVKELHAIGMTQRTIGQQVGLSHKTVQRWLTLTTFPERQPRAMLGSVLDPYKGYLLERWTAGCHNGARLFDEIVARGYQGRRTTLRDFLARLRPPRGTRRTADSSTPPPSAGGKAEQRPSVRQLVWTVLRRPDKITEEDRTVVAHLRTAHPEVEQAVTFAQAFAQMIRERQPDLLESWLWQVANSNVAALRSFAAGIQRDKPAVLAGLTLESSQGQTEGQITRFKLIKRSTYGRANFDLLRQRVLHAGEQTNICSGLHQTCG
jgi:transposase